jgi:TonB family protein
MNKFFSIILFVLIFSCFSFGQESATKPPTGNGTGQGSGGGKSSEVSKPVIPNTDKKVTVRISSKPSPKYTDTARKNGTEGIVRLRVTFLASGEIGAVTPVSGLPNGLTEQAIAAARNLKFEPATRNGVPIDTIKLIEYSFTLYYEENDDRLAQNAEILEATTAEYPQESVLQNTGGKVKVLVALSSNGTAQVVKINSDLPKEFVQKVTEAVAKIRFKPAIHKNGKAVTQTKEIEYEFSIRKN